MKYLILKTIVLLVALMFIGTAFLMAETHDYNSATSRNRSNIGITIFSQKSGPNNSGYVKYTLDLTNNTLINGNFVNTHNGLFPSGAAFDSANGYVYVTDFLSNNVSVINGSTNNVISTIDVGSPDAATFDSSNGYVYISNCFSSSVSVINGSTNNVISTIDVGQHPSGAAFDPSNGYVYVANAYSNNVSVINGSTDSVIATISVGSGPSGVAFDPINGYIYVTNYESDNVSVINGSTNNVISTIDVGSYPQRAAFDSANGYVYVTNFLSNNVSVINGSSNKFISTVDVGSYPHGVAFDPTNGYIYVTNDGSGNVSVINGSTNNVISTIDVGSSPYGAVFDSSNGYVYVTNTGSGNVSVINGSTNRVISTISVGLGPLGAAFDSANGYVYVTDFTSGSVLVINGSTNKVTQSISVGLFPTAVAVDSLNGNIYVTNIESDNVSVINGSSNSVIATISVGLGPSGATFDPSNGYVYVTNTGSGNVSVINGSTNSVISTIDVGSYPQGATFDPSNGYVYVTNTGSDNVSVINGSSNSVIATISVGSGPIISIFDTEIFSTGIVFDPNNGYVYVTNVASGTVSIISTSALNMKYYTVTFTESNLPSGTTWAVTLNGTAESSTSSTISFYEPNGTYSYSVSSPSHYTVSPSSGYVTVNANNASVVVNYSRYAYLKIFVSPSSAVVSINGVNETTSSGSLSTYLNQGYYYLNASESGYRPYSDYVYLSYNSNYSHSIILQKISNAGYLTGSVSPSSATIVVSGTAIPVSNGHFNASLSPGTYYVSFTANGYNSIVKEINITTGKTSTLDVSLTPVSNSITLSGYISPENASLVVNGFIAYVNSSGYYHISVSAGTYTISIYENGYFPYSENVTLSSSRVMNFTLVKEPKATSTTSSNNTVATGYNVTVSNITTGNGIILVSFNANANGTLIVQIPYSSMKNATISEILNSTVYINGVPYKNYTVSISSNYTIILKVYGLKSGDPTLSWKYSPSGIVPTPTPPSSVSPPPSLFVYEVMGAIIAVGIVAGVVAMTLGKRRR